MLRNNKIRKVFAGAGGLAIVGIGAGASFAATGSFVASGSTVRVIHACEAVKTHALSLANGTRCPKRTVKISWNQQGIAGLQGKVGAPGKNGAQGPAGPAGPQGPSGVVSTGTTQLAATPMSVPTGGSFSKRATAIGAVQLSAGTYLISVNAIATPDATTTGNVFPQFMVYQAAFTGSNWSDDVFNIGAGALENPNATELSQGNLINSYYGGSTEITVPAGGETLHVYGFGYDDDQGEGSYTLNSLTVTATQVSPAAS